MRFEKIDIEEAIEAYDQAIEGCSGSYREKKDLLKHVLNTMELPSRSTACSAGYDFRSPFDVSVEAGEVVRMPLFVKVKDMPPNVVLLLFNRSGLSLKKGLRLDNAVGVIDSDYDQCIWFQATATKDIVIIQGDKICQGIFLPIMFVADDNAQGKRNGGFGSTGR